MAPVLPRDIVARIKDETDIVSLVREYVQLKPAGSAFKGLCPFHRDSNPSLHVNPQLQIYKCFACGEGGDAISFLMKLQGISFPEALEILARPLNIDLSRYLVDNDEGEGERQAFFRANEVAAEVWTEALWSDAGRAAREYLAERGFGEEILRRFDAGYADAGHGLAKALEASGVGRELALRAGLLGKGDDGRVFAYFRRRIIFPIRNIAQRVAGFGGRLTGSGEPKYLNSQESAHFNKRRLLYGFSSSRIAVARGGTAILVEGYLDLIALAQAGYNNVVATCGTAFTPDQARVLKRGCRTLYILFDGDQAGLKASVKAAATALAVGLEPKVARLPAGEDPASLLNEGGGDLAPVLENALGYLPLLRDLADASGKGREGRERALRAAVNTIAGIDDPIRRACLVTEAAERFDIEEVVLREEIQRLHDRQKRREARRGATDRSGPGPAPAEIGSEREQPLGIDLRRVEAKVLAHALADPSGEGARRTLDLWRERRFADPQAERLREQLAEWLESHRDGEAPADFVRQSWHEETEAYRGFVSDLLTDEEARASRHHARYVEEAADRLDDLERRRRGVDELRAWTGDRGEETT